MTDWDKIWETFHRLWGFAIDKRYDKDTVKKDWVNLQTYLQILQAEHKCAPSRETCSECGKISAVGFHVPDEIWRQAIPPDRQQDIFCIGCFVLYADRRYLPWDGEIEFYPVSKKTHREFVQS